jgi:hypothetical protein
MQVLQALRRGCQHQCSEGSDDVIKPDPDGSTSAHA